MPQQMQLRLVLPIAHVLSSLPCVLSLLGVDLSSLDDSLTRPALLRALSIALNRDPDAIDLYRAARALYESARYQAAANLLRVLVEEEGVEAPGYHLLAHALFMSGHKREALPHLKKVANGQPKLRWIGCRCCTRCA